MLAELSYDGRQARIRFDRTVSDPSGAPDLEQACQLELTRKAARSLTGLAGRPQAHRDLPRFIGRAGGRRRRRIHAVIAFRLTGRDALKHP
jgi:hypothetical protein